MENDASSEGEAKYKFRCDKEQYARLKRCSEKRNMTEWNEWYKRNQKDRKYLWSAHLEGADLKGAHLEGAYFWGAYLEGADLRGARLEGANLYGASLKKAGLLEAHLEGADLRVAHLENACLQGARLKGANLRRAHLEGAVLLRANLEKAVLRSAHLEGAVLREAHLEKTNLRFAYLQNANLRQAHLEGADLIETHLERVAFNRSHLEGADFRAAAVDGATLIWNCEIDRATNFTGVGLDSARVAPGLKRSLKDNIRRIAWKNWYASGRTQEEQKCPWWTEFRRRIILQPFWWISDYARSTKRIMMVFFALAAYFAFAYWLHPGCVEGLRATHDFRGYLHALYFSVVTMTTLGFGDIHANPDSSYGQLLLMVQVILGYVLLGALVTRFAVLFSGEGPAKEFAKKGKRKCAPKAQQKEDGAEDGAENSKP